MPDLKQALPRAWANRAPWLLALLPLSALYGAVTSLQRLAYRVGYKHAYRAPVPVMVIGNITVGGSGKTPLIIALVEYLRQRGVRVGVISRGYGGVGPFPRVVQADDSPDQVGDEPLLIVQQTHVALAVGPNRQAAIECLLAVGPLDLILSDDGLQHLALARDLEWIVLDTRRGLGNGWLLPAGPLRESAQRLQTTTVIEHGPSTADLQMQLVAGALQPLQVNAANQATGSEPQVGMRVHAVAGIGDPARFFATVRGLGFEPIEHPFADHHAYQASDAQFDDGLPMLTTAKDAVKLQALGVSGWVVPVQAQLSAGCYALLDAQLQALGVVFKG
jgi:tetraacyldisaccharide 4'-kinase